MLSVPKPVDKLLIITPEFTLEVIPFKESKESKEESKNLPHHCTQDDNCCITHVKKKQTFKVVPKSSRFGSCVRIESNLYDTLLTLPKNISACQIYLEDVKPYTTKSLNKKDVVRSAEFCYEYGKAIYVHCPLNCNLAYKTSDYITRSSLKVVSDELHQVYGLPAACVLHIGKEGKNSGTIENVANHVNLLDETGFLKLCPDNKIKRPLLLEVAAGQKGELGTSKKELRHLFEAIDSNKVGICLDTQHAFASGLSDFNDHESIVKLFDCLKNISGTKIGLIHLNDSLGSHKCHVDRHAPLSEGHIWSSDTESLSSLVSICDEEGIDMITETKKSEKDAKLIRKIRRKNAGFST